MKIKTAEASGMVLDWLVAKVEGEDLAALNILHPEQATVYTKWAPSKDWALAGPIIEREGICITKRYAPVVLDKYAKAVVDWTAAYFTPPHSALITHRRFGPTPLIAAMRCFVAAALGDEVEVPEELA